MSTFQRQLQHPNCMIVLIYAMSMLNLDWNWGVISESFSHLFHLTKYLALFVFLGDYADDEQLRVLICEVMHYLSFGLTLQQSL